MINYTAEIFHGPSRASQLVFYYKAKFKIIDKLQIGFTNEWKQINKYRTIKITSLAIVYYYYLFLRCYTINMT